MPLEKAAIPFIKSTLEETVNKLPDDFVMKGSSISSHLKKVSSSLTGKQIKDEEINFSGVFEGFDNNQTRFTKQDLVTRVQSRHDKNTTTILEGTNASYREIVPKVFKSPDYVEKVRRFSLASEIAPRIDMKGREIPRVRSHFNNKGIDDVLWHTRVAPLKLKGEKGNVILELQSDPIQAGGRFGFTFEDTNSLLFKALENVKVINKKIAAMDSQIADVYDQWKFNLYDINTSTASMDEIGQQLSKLRTEQVDLKLKRLTLEEKQSKLLGSHNDQLLNIVDVFRDAVAINIKLADHTDRTGTATLATPKDYAKIAQDIGLPEKEAKQLSIDIQAVIDQEVKSANNEFSLTNPFAVNIQINNLVKDAFTNAKTNVGNKFKDSTDQLPFKNNAWVDKALEAELADAAMEGKQFIGVPITVGDDSLKRGQGVQKWYENFVDKKMESKVKELNKGILKHTPDATDDELFHYTKVKINGGVRFKINVDDISEFQAGIVDLDIDDLEVLADAVEVSPADVHARMSEVSNRVNTTDDDELTRLAMADLITTEADEMSPEDRNILLSEIMDNTTGEKIEHSLAKITLPKVTKTEEQVARTELQAPRGHFDRIELEKFITSSPMKLIKQWIGFSPELRRTLEAKNISFSDDNVAAKAEIMYHITKLPSEEQAKLAKVIDMELVTESTNPSKVLPKWMTDLRLYSAAPAGLTAPAINEALKQPGATNENVSDYLVNNLGHDRAEVDSLIDEIMEKKVSELIQQGATPKRIAEELSARGYKTKDINRYLPSNSVLMDLIKFQNKNVEMTGNMVEGLMEFIIGVPTNAQDTEKTAAMALSANETVESIINNVGGVFNREMAIKGKSQLEAINIEINKALEKQGIESKAGEDGDILVPDSNGTFVPLDVGLYDTLWARRDEMSLAIASGIAASRAMPGPWWAKGVAGAVGGATGAGIGRGFDMVRNMLYNKQVIEEKFIMDQMLKTGAADIVFTTIGAGAFAVGSGTVKAVKKAWDFIVKGNPEGANKMLLELMHMTPEEAETIVKQWENLNNKKVKGTQAERNLSIIPRVASDVATLTGPAAKFSAQMSSNLAREISQRAKDLIRTVNIGTNEKTGAVLRDELPDYIEKVRNIYTGTKEIAIRQMNFTDYNFNYEQLIDEKLIDDAINGIMNPTLRDQAVNLFNRIKSIGGTSIETLDGPVNINPRRSFSELLDLRELVADFISNKTINSKKDVDLFNNMLNGVDKEIKRATRNNMEGASNWLEAWTKAVQAKSNLTNIKSNVLVKAIMKNGATDDSILRALVKSANAVDGTYREVLQMLPKKVVPAVETSILRELVEKFSVGEEAGKQAIDFVALQKELQHIPFTSEGNKKIKQAIGELSRVYKNDPHLMAATGTVRSPSFQSYLTDNPVIRLKYALVSEGFNYAMRLSPLDRGKQSAMITNIARLLKNPGDSKKIAEIIADLPSDPELRNSLKTQAAKIAAFNEKSNFPKVEVFSVAKVGQSKTVTDGPLGKGVYLFTDKTKARATSKLAGSKLTTELVHPERIADDVVIRDTLNLDPDIEITSEFIKTHPTLRKLLEDRAYTGIIFDDRILTF